MKRASASALCAPCGRNARSGAGLAATESSWRTTGFAGWARGIFGGEALGTCALAIVAPPIKLSAKRNVRQAQQTHQFFCSLTLNLIFLARSRQTSRAAALLTKTNESVPYNL